MPKKSIEEQMLEIKDLLTTKIRERDKLVIKVNEVAREINNLLEKQYNLDPTKIQIKCINCRGLGYIPEEDKKKVCTVCNGSKYNWAEAYIEE